MPVRIVEWKLPYTWGTGIEIDSNKVISLLLREENNLIMVNDDNEVYTDLQLEDWILPTDEFPVWVTVGKVLQSDGWTQSWLLLNWKTTSGDYARWIYANDGNIYFDNGTWTWKQVYYSSQVDAAIAALRTEVYDYFIRYQDYYWVTKTGNQFNLELSCEIEPDQNFVVDAPLNIEEWQTYVLRVKNWATSYVMSLWAYVTNPKWTSIALNPNTTDTFVFLAVDDTRVELQPVIDQASSVNDGILTIQKNWSTVWTFTANQATNSTINVTVPTVIDNLTSTSTTNSLSANQWSVLKWMIDDLAGFGKFLSLWNATTGQPISFPLATPYTYSTWDYFVVETISSATPPVNYRPNGSSYTGTASSTTESDELEVWDVYVYDGSVWLLQSNHWKTVTFWNIAWDPYDNTNLSNALNAKQDTLVAWSNITIDPNTNEISANNTTYSSATSTTAWIVKLWDDTVQTDTMNSPSATTWKTYPVQLNASGQMSVNVPRANTTYSSLPAASWWADVSLVTTGEKYTWNTAAADTNTKTFYLSSTSDLINAQAAYNWYLAWKNPIVVLGWINYVWVGGGSLLYTLISSKQVVVTSVSNDCSITYQEALKFTLNSGVVTGITLGTTSLSDDLYVLDTVTNYSTPYTPQYDWSPATKKYVDDRAVPTSWTTWYVLTKTAWWYDWAAAPATWITNDTTWTTTTVTKIRAWTEAEYALITPNANTIYYTF